MSSSFPDYMAGHLEQQRTNEYYFSLLYSWSPRAAEASEYYLSDYNTGHLQQQRTSEYYFSWLYGWSPTAAGDKW